MKLNGEHSIKRLRDDLVLRRQRRQVLCVGVLGLLLLLGLLLRSGQAWDVVAVVVSGLAFFAISKLGPVNFIGLLSRIGEQADSSKDLGSVYNEANKYLAYKRWRIGGSIVFISVGASLLVYFPETSGFLRVMLLAAGLVCMFVGVRSITSVLEVETIRRELER